jgi:hypothetical protein
LHKKARILNYIWRAVSIFSLAKIKEFLFKASPLREQIRLSKN